MSDGYEVRADGSVVVWSDNEGVMITPCQGGMIFVSGRRGDHPFDALLSVLSWESVAVLRDRLTEALESH